MKSYGQFCPLAKALDAVGDRWSLLIVRELLIRGPSRYTDLKTSLPGIATNLLAERLASLEAAGVVSRDETSAPVPAVLYSLTERGRALEPALHALGAWGEPLLARPAKTDTFRSHWMALPARMHLRDHAPHLPKALIEVRAGEEPMLITVHDGRVSMAPGSAPHTDAIITGSPALVVQLLVGGMSLNDASAWGLEFEGDASALLRVQPRAGQADGLALQRALFPA